VDQECAYFIIAHFVRMALAMEKDIAFDPVDVCLLRAVGIMFQRQLFADLVKKFDLGALVPLASKMTLLSSDGNHDQVRRVMDIIENFPLNTLYRCDNRKICSS
jgi:hypothetical protein